MKCPYTGSENWESVEVYRHLCDEKDFDKMVPENKRAGMMINLDSGFISYPERVDKQALGEYYETEYRQPPSINNIYAGERKLHFHGAFLDDVFKRWKKEGKTDPVFCEIGAAFGMVLNWFKQQWPEADVTGTELTKSFIRNAYHEFGFELKKDIDTTKKHDLIMSYKVEEHIPDPIEHLKKLKSCLKDDGYLYVSVPTWLGTLNNFGKGGFDLDYYYHPDHINVWTRKLFETALKMAGFKIIKFNDTIYDDTYLCKIDKDFKEGEYKPELEDANEIKKRLASAKEAAVAFLQNDCQKAIASYPDFPIAWQRFYELKRQDYHQKGFEFIKEGFIDRARKACPSSPEIGFLEADIYFRYEKFGPCIEACQRVLEMKPNYIAALDLMSQCHRLLSEREKDEKKKVEFRTTARDIMRHLYSVSQQSRGMAVNWMYEDNANIPCPWERDAAK